MRDEPFRAFVAGIVAGMVAATLITTIAFMYRENYLVKKAACVEAGVAEYRVDPQTGAVRFEFLKQGEDHGEGGSL